MKKLCLLLLLFAGFTAYGQRNSVTFTFNNTSSTSAPLNCSYTVCMTVQACSLSVCQTLSTQCTSTIAPGGSGQITFTPASGYTINTSTAVFTVTGATVDVFGTSFDVDQGNCASTSAANYVTVWTPVNSTTYNVHADIVLGP